MSAVKIALALVTREHPAVLLEALDGLIHLCAGAADREAAVARCGLGFCDDGRCVDLDG